MVGLTEKAELCWDSDLRLTVCVQFGRTREPLRVSKQSLMGGQCEAHGYLGAREGLVSTGNRDFWHHRC